jgi:hypothetical protein
MKEAALSKNADPGMRELECGCWQRWIEGDIVTSKFAGWVTIWHCPEHKAQESATAGDSEKSI